MKSVNRSLMFRRCCIMSVRQTFWNVILMHYACMLAVQVDNSTLVSCWAAAVHCQCRWERPCYHMEYTYWQYVIISAFVIWCTCFLLDIFSNNRTHPCCWVSYTDNLRVSYWLFGGSFLVKSTTIGHVI